MRLALCLPTLNAAITARSWLAALTSQTLTDLDCMVIDSSSNDATPQLFTDAGFRVHIIPRESFNHGATRQLGVELCPDADILIFMTQDALLATPESLHNLVAAFDDPRVGATFGRQLPREAAGPIEAHARLFNYPPESLLKSSADTPLLGIKTVFMSNSFAAYRCSALKDVGGFPINAIVSEETYVAAKMLESRWKIKYCADATVYHSHNYSIQQEFQRYFDLGVFHSREPWIMEQFGAPEGEGKRFILSELKFMWPRHWFILPKVFLKTVVKYLGFRLGRLERVLPLWLNTRCTMHPLFFLTSSKKS